MIHELKPHILVMEDEVYIRDIIVLNLERAGYQVDAVESVSQARDMLGENRYDIFLSDIRLGSERGTDLLREQWDHLKAQGTQVIVLSAEELYRSDVEKIGVEFFLSKPFTGKMLLTLIERLTTAVSNSS